MIQIEKRMRKTSYSHRFGEPWKKTRLLSRSFDTLEEATRFAEGKKITDIYKSKGRYKVEWLKVEYIYEE